MPKIFASYKRADRPFLDQLLPLFATEYEKDSVWFDDDIPGGSDWWAVILQHIDVCPIFIFLMSNDALRSEYCLAELREAIRLNKAIFPVVGRLQTELPPNLPDDIATFLKKHQQITLMNKRGEVDPQGWARLNKDIREALKRLPAEPLPPKTEVPTPEPVVKDKPAPSRSPWMSPAMSWIVLSVIMLLGIAIPLLNANLSGSPTPQATTAVAQAESPTETPSRPLTGAEILATSDAELTQTAQAIVVAQQTADAVATNQIIMTQTQVAFDATETISWGTLYARTASLTPINTHTPTPTPTLKATQALEAFARTPIPENAAWTPVERTFEDGVTMVYVPTGCFMMGSNQYDDEKPIHEQCITEPFWLDKTEVTQAQFVANGGVKANANGFTGDDRPVEQITWGEARAYCEKRGGRLPTEAEWEFAARGPDGLIYPWGRESVTELAIGGDDPIYGDKSTAPVGNKPDGASWVGALDLSGNVWEWTSSQYWDYPYDPDDGRENLTVVGERVSRGGSWYGYYSSRRAAVRYNNPPDYVAVFVGFRCARSFTLEIDDLETGGM